MKKQTTDIQRRAGIAERSKKFAEHLFKIGAVSGVYDDISEEGKGMRITVMYVAIKPMDKPHTRVIK